MYGFRNIQSDGNGSPAERLCGEHFTRIVSDLMATICTTSSDMSDDDKQAVLDIVCFLAQGAWNIAVMCGDMRSTEFGIAKFVAGTKFANEAFAPAYMEYVAREKLEKYTDDDLLVRRVVPELSGKGAEIGVEFMEK